MKASDAIAKILSANNVTVGFELIGGMITHLVDSINVLGDTKLISVHHEQAAAFAAGGVARATNNKSLGLALGTSGPGATNLITGIADCWFDNYPCIFITGQVNTNELKGTRNIRQQGFQELDIVSIVKSITKYAVQIQTADDIVIEIQKAIDISVSGRPGPVLIDIPMDLQRAELDDNTLDYLIDRINSKPEFPELRESTKSQLQESVECLLNAKQPVFLIGGGAVSEDSFAIWQQDISKSKIPHVASLKGSEKTPVLDGYWGMIGAYGTRTANYAIQNADVIIVLGSRLDVRQTGADVSDFARLAKKVIQIDLDSAQLDNRFKADINIHATCEQFFQVYLQSINKKELINNDWVSTLKLHWKNSFINEYPELEISPFNICEMLLKRFKNIAAHFVADVGNNQMWIAHSLRIGPSQMVHHSGGLGAMGFAIPTSLGVHYATDSIVVSISGDGGAQINIQELDIISRENLPILTIVINNQSLGMVRAFQEMYFEGRNQSTYWDGYSSSFCDIGIAYQMKSSMITSEKEFDNAIFEFIQNPQPTLLELMMPDARECKPRLAFGNPIDKQHPNGNT
ncbi:thiamine pyrophosphate-binding protein [Shewanella sp. D64]|uniref:thiamine pyrophosphate-binding protein n=1 Tax=unclassified Shewanella TaxID=196818 RepID=UPI0022BA573D|nr:MULTISPECIES: thiamine pyrophosphate-binding protein [unclassified Shewanella]MEC4727727.1 thiamine pyrophosphate-binding protein [Shewanella sp. D64]MEC4737490.1 thiamine pyrophosphate-binding protein [Shewanella sp. E94]WBJ97301.1 thiamine pyrophosphate-binding protein [Shewanella sp. MTB7]